MIPEKPQFGKSQGKQVLTEKDIEAALDYAAAVRAERGYSKLVGSNRALGDDGKSFEEPEESSKYSGESATALAKEVIQFSQGTVLVSLRFMDAAFHQLTPSPSERFELATDGENLFYSVDHILNTFDEEPNQIARDILHTVLHCVFHHVFVWRPVQRLLWDTACDIAIEAQIEELSLPATHCARASDQKRVLDMLQKELPVLSAQTIYRFFIESDLSDDEIESIRSLFYADDHQTWYRLDNESTESTDDSELSDEDGKGKPHIDSQSDESSTDQPDEGEDQDQNPTAEGIESRDDDDQPGNEDEEYDQGSRGSQGEDTDQTGSTDGGGSSDVDGASDSQRSSDEETAADAEGKADSKADDSSGSEGEGDSGERPKDQSSRPDNYEGQAPVEDPLKNTWDNITERMEVDLDTFSRGFSSDETGLAKQIRALNRERYDYATFLRQFAVLGEAMQINHEEFDYIYYTYGLKLYEKMPLVEPLEYLETNRIREFVIAIDTSASTSGALVEAFITKTFNMLKATENYFTNINIHIIQADQEVQDVVKITNEDELHAYSGVEMIRGFGGTDFRPVFEYVDQQLAEGEFSDLGGLIYFTDGEGVYPDHQPEYKTAFVFLDDSLSNPEVPIWAIKLIMESEDL